MGSEKWAFLRQPLTCTIGRYTLPIKRKVIYLKTYYVSIVILWIQYKLVLDLLVILNKLDFTQANMVY